MKRRPSCGSVKALWQSGLSQADLSPHAKIPRRRKAHTSSARQIALQH
nr:MAG TPA: hypothetical protein [Caudoviricetes sp.]